MVSHCVLRSKRKNVVTLPYSAQRKPAFWGGGKEMQKTKKLSSRSKVALLLLHEIFGNISTRQLLAKDTAYVWYDEELRIDPDVFCTSCQISSMNKKARYNNPLKPKSAFKSFLMDIIPSTAPKFLTIDTTFSNYILIVDA